MPFADPDVGPWCEFGWEEPPELCGGAECDPEVEPEGLVELGLGVVLDPEGVVVEVVGVVLVGVVLVLVVVVLGNGVVGVVTVGVVDGAGGQDSVMLFTGCVMFSDESGAPCGSWKYRTWPVSSVTVTVQSAAEAAGRAATLRKAAMTASVASAALSFRPLNTAALSPPDMRKAPEYVRHD